MSFCIVKNHEINLKHQNGGDSDIFKRPIQVPVTLIAINNEASNINNSDLLKLTNTLDEYFACLPPGRTEEHTDWMLDVVVHIISSNGNYKDIISIPKRYDYGSRHFLEELENFGKINGISMKVKVEIRNWSYGPTVVDEAVTNGVDIEEISSWRGSQLFFSGYWDHTDWKENTNKFKGFLTISVHVCSSLFVTDTIFSNPSQMKEEPYIVRKILEEELNCDAVIIAAGNTEVKCHKLFLTVPSPVLQAMFKDTYEESNKCKTCTVKIPEMTEAGIKAFLAYLYYGGIDKPNECCDIAVEILEAAHKYDIPELEENIKEILLSKPFDWYNADASLRLLVFARNLSDVDFLKKMASKLLRANLEDKVEY